MTQVIKKGSLITLRGDEILMTESPFETPKWSIWIPRLQGLALVLSKSLEYKHTWGCGKAADHASVSKETKEYKGRVYYKIDRVAIGFWILYDREILFLRTN